LNKASIVYNPAARNAPPRQRLQDAAGCLKQNDWDVELRVSEAPGHARELAREAAAGGASVVFSCGGDGTLNEVVNGIAGSEATLGVLRGGMGNVFAKEIGVPRAPAKALQALVDGETRRFDLGKAGERYFLLMCGIGFDAHVVRRVSPRLKRWLGSTAYALLAMAMLPAYRPARIHMRLNGIEDDAEVYWLLLGNTRSYGGVIDITRRALADDGLLDAFVFEGSSRAWAFKTGALIAFGRAEGANGVSFLRVLRLEIDTPGIPVQADGEYFGETPMTFTIEPRVLPVLLPPGRGTHLLSRGR
jgi:diacylglycerol kinase (ATP)